MENTQEQSSSDDSMECTLLTTDLENDMEVLRYLYSLLHARRHKLEHMQTIENVIEAINQSQYILVVCGAGVSVSCGIPDFRSSDGLYARLGADYPELSSPTDIFSLDFFRRNPVPFYRLCRDMSLGNAQPGVTHRFIRALESQGKLLNCYTQNVDGLDRLAGTGRVVECHGSFSHSECMDCGFREETEALRSVIAEQRVPVCSACGKGIMKPCIVFFGEQLGDDFHEQIAMDVGKCDLVLVIGSSLTVSPVSGIPRRVHNSIPQILINRQALPNFTFDVELLGDCDLVLAHIATLLGDAFAGVSVPVGMQQRHLSELEGSSIVGDEVFFHCPPSRYYFRNAQIDD